jgi:uncharacterized protein
MQIVLDTNILLVSISSKSPFHWVYKLFMDRKITLCVTTDILLEYHEIIAREMGEKVANEVLKTIENASNVLRITRYYEWKLIAADPDDNKFVDCAVAANALFLVTEDKHFKILKKLAFPKINVIGLNDFKKITEIL